MFHFTDHTPVGPVDLALRGTGLRTGHSSGPWPYHTQGGCRGRYNVLAEAELAKTENLKDLDTLTSTSQRGRLAR